jgi:hypothetical protein
MEVLLRPLRNLCDFCVRLSAFWLRIPAPSFLLHNPPIR